MSTTIIVTGSRDWEDAELLGRTLATFNPTLIVQGGARGADKLARDWAMENRIELVNIPADWDKYGKAAGTFRNVEMLKRYPLAMVVAFPLPQSRGTYHCIREAVKRDHTVLVVKPSGDWSVVA